MLLEAGAGAATRRAAARQLGEVQKAHPEELHRLLGRLMKHLRSPAWETRVAASQVNVSVRIECDNKVNDVCNSQLRCDSRVLTVLAISRRVGISPHHKIAQKYF